MNKLLAIGLLAFGQSPLAPQFAAAGTSSHHGALFYAGEEACAISSLSAEDIAELRSFSQGR